MATHQRGGAASKTPADFVVATDAYADYLRVERGLAAATIRAYDTDLRMFGRDAPGIETVGGLAGAGARLPRSHGPTATGAATHEPAPEGRLDPRLLPLLLRGRADRG